METVRSDAYLWEEYRSVLGRHIHIHKGHDVVDTINRLLEKNSWLKQSGTTFQITRTNLQISEESWELSRLWPLAQKTSDEPKSLNGAVLLLRWAGLEYLIDGRRRVNCWHRLDVPGPHRALVLHDT